MPRDDSTRESLPSDGATPLMQRVPKEFQEYCLDRFLAAIRNLRKDNN
ncbi:MAG: hypothetical protein P4L16_08385 [Chlamydiales bacterium]|nr:hypothetical protein [Chlamydiales bacterium]